MMEMKQLMIYLGFGLILLPPVLVVAQCFLSKKLGKPGLALPIIVIGLGIISPPLLGLGAVLLAIHFIVTRIEKKKVSEIEKMNIQDLD